MNPLIVRGRLAVSAAVVCVLAGALLLWLFWPSKPAIPGAERVRQYTNIRACMLTGAHGVTGAEAAAAWAGMQGASSSTRAMVSYLPVPEPGGKTAAVPYLASLVQRQCSVIIAVGRPQVAAAISQAARYRHVHFIVIIQGPAGSAGQPASAVIRIASGPAAQLRSAVEAAVSAAVNGWPARVPAVWVSSASDRGQHGGTWHLRPVDRPGYGDRGDVPADHRSRAARHRDDGEQSLA